MVRAWLAQQITEARDQGLAGIGIRENRDVSGPIISHKMNLKKPGYQFKQQTKALEPWKGKSPACSCLSAQIVVLEEFRVFVQAVCVHWSSSSAQSEQLGGCSQPWSRDTSQSQPCVPLAWDPNPRVTPVVIPSSGGVEFYYSLTVPLPLSLLVWIRAWLILLVYRTNQLDKSYYILDHWQRRGNDIETGKCNVVPADLMSPTCSISCTAPSAAGGNRGNSVPFSSSPVWVSGLS